MEIQSPLVNTTFWLVLFLVPAIAYVILIPKLPFTGDFVLKSIPVLLLAVTSLIFIPGTAGKLLFAGFLLSAGGDISLSFEGEKAFVMGLSFFLLAHVVYIILFAQDFTFSPGKLPLALIVGGLAITMSIILFPKLGEMRLPVLVYITVIMAMGVVAAFWTGGASSTAILLFVGAAVFMLSDSMIAVNKFLVPISWSKFFIMITYYAAQLMIWMSFVKANS